MASRSRLVSMAVLSGLLFVLAACGGEPPDKEIQQAVEAVATAQAAGAGRYAVDELTAAQDALTHAREAVDQHDYRLALNHALDSRERAQTAATEAAAGMASARTEAGKALAAALTAVGDAHTRLKSAETAHIPPRALAGPRTGIGDADARVQEARTAFEKGDYAKATAGAAAATEQVTAAVAALSEATAPPVRRRR